MGTLYREIVEYRYQRAAKLFLKLFFAVIALDFIFIAISLKRIIDEFVYIGYGILPFMVLASIYIWRKYKKRYRYAIIDKEMIIEKLNGRKRRVVLNLNIRQIISIEKVGSTQDNVPIEKEYNFTCCSKKEYSYRCIFQREGKYYGFYFEPSMDFIRKVSMFR